MAARSPVPSLGRFPTTRQLRVLRWLALLATIEVLFQGATAGELLSGRGSALALHAGGAIALHVLTGLTALAAAWYWRSTRGRLWPVVLAVVVFVATFVQAGLGDLNLLAAHVPLALGLLLGLAWLLAWAWLSPTAAEK